MRALLRDPKHHLTAAFGARPGDFLLNLHVSALLDRGDHQMNRNAAAADERFHWYLAVGLHKRAEARLPGGPRKRSALPQRSAYAAAPGGLREGSLCCFPFSHALSVYAADRPRSLG